MADYVTIPSEESGKDTTYEQWLKDTADAIREKDNTASTIKALSFPDRIKAIPVLDTSDATAVAGDILDGKTAYRDH